MKTSSRSDSATEFNKQISLLGKRIEVAAINRDIVLLADLISTLRTYVLEQIKSLKIDLDGNNLD